MHQSRKYGKGKRQRRVEAVERQARYDALSHTEKVEKASNAPGHSTRQLLRLWNEAEKAPVPEVSKTPAKPAGKRHNPAPSKTQIKRAKREAKS